MVILKRIIISFMLLDNFIVQGFKRLFPTRYKIRGNCKQCGKCCEEILLRGTNRQINNPFFRNIAIRWISWLYGFYLLYVDYERNYLAFSCSHRGEDGKCKNYFLRPPICRNYPLLDYFEEPKFLPWCSFCK